MPSGAKSKTQVAEDIWSQIETEYVTTGTSYRALGKKYGLPYSKVRNYGAEHNWVAKREQCQAKTVQKSIEIISDQQANQIAKALRIGNRILDKIEEALEDIDKVPIKTTVTKKTIERDDDGQAAEVTRTTENYELKKMTVDKAGLRQLAATLKDLKEIKVFCNELDKQEQLARIARLQKDAEKNEEDKEIQVIIGDELEDYSG